MKTKKTIELDIEDLKWFNRAYADASLSWLLGLLLGSFRSIHEDTGVMPNLVAKDAAKEIKDQLKDADS